MNTWFVYTCVATTVVVQREAVARKFQPGMYKHSKLYPLHIVTAQRDNDSQRDYKHGGALLKSTGGIEANVSDANGQSSWSN